MSSPARRRWGSRPSPGHVGWGEAALGFFLPALLGNILGGVTLVAVLNHAQVVGGK